MKALFWIAALMVSIAAHATTVYIVSDALDTTNNSGAPTLDLTGWDQPNLAWGRAFPGSDWISYGPTGARSDPGYFSPPNGTVVTFTTQFVLSGDITGANLRVMADDTSSVVLNGHTLIAANLKKGPVCAQGAIGCLPWTEGDFTFAALAPFLIDGTNTLSFGVVQVNGSSFGLDFKGVVHTEGEETPEPATPALVAGGLFGFLMLRLRPKYEFKPARFCGTLRVYKSIKNRRGVSFSEWHWRVKQN